MDSPVQQPLFPNRPLKVTLPKPPSRLGALLLFMVGVAFVAGIGFLMGPGLVRDAQLLGNSEPATAARFVSGRCKSKLIIHFCDVTIERRGPSGVVREESNFGFFDLHFGSNSIQLVQKKGDPTLVASDLAIDQFWNRVITAGLFILLFGAGALASLRQASRQGLGDINQSFRALSGQILTLQIVEVFDRASPAKGAWLWSYHPLANGPASPPTFTLFVPEGTWPFILDRAGRRALAASRTDGGPVLMLDSGLTFLNLKKDEQQRIFAWRDNLLAAEDARMQGQAQGA